MDVVDPERLREVIDSLGLSFKQNSKSWIFNCPKCGKEKLYIRKRDGVWICWSDAITQGYRGVSPIVPLADLSGLSRANIRAQLFGVAIDGENTIVWNFHGFFDNSANEEEIIIEEEFGPEPIEWPFNYYPIDHPKAVRGRQYLEKRGIPLSVAKCYGIRYAPEETRVVFPVESEGVLYGYQKRLIVPNKFVDEDGFVQEVPKVLSSSNLPRHEMAMFVDRLNGVEHCILTEGPVDAIKCDGLGGNICLMGKIATNGQLKAIRARPAIKRIYLALDADAATETMALARKLENEYELFRLVPEQKGGKVDLGDLSFEEVQKLFHEAIRIDSRDFFSDFTT